MIDNLILGFSVTLQAENLMYAFIGSLLGTFIGVLPGIGPLATIALLLPLTFSLQPVSAIIMLSAIYYGAQYGGSTTAILIKMPGESSSVVACLDGHAMARKGKAGTALAIAAIGSFIAGCFATLVIAYAAPVLVEFALEFRSPEYFSLMVLGLLAAISLGSGSFIKSLGMMLIGLLFGLVGTDLTSGQLRFTFGMEHLYDGIEFVALVIGIFALTEVALNLERPQAANLTTASIQGLWPKWEDLKQAIAPILRGTAIGSVLGVLPGGGALLSSLAAYALEKKVSRHPEEFGKGRIEGVAAPEAANNAGAQTSFIPMLALGLPSTPVKALLLGALLIHGVTPGPNLLNRNPDLFWGIVASMWIGNLMLLVLNLPLVGLWARLLRVPYGILFPMIVVLACVGIFGAQGEAVSILFAAGFALGGYVLIKLGCELAPMALSFILGPLMEEYFRRSIQLSRGDLAVFIDRPVSATLLAVAGVLICFHAFSSFRQFRKRHLYES